MIRNADRTITLEVGDIVYDKRNFYSKVIVFGYEGQETIMVQGHDNDNKYWIHRKYLAIA